MKKIYSKITKERRKQFQIETYIMKDGEQRLVVKRALAKDGAAHIRKMSDYYEKNKDEGILLFMFIKMLKVHQEIVKICM